MLGACVHFLYIGLMVYYTNEIYIKDSLQSNVPRAKEDRSSFPLILVAGQITPIYEETCAIFIMGKKYWRIPENYLDLIFIICGVYNAIEQYLGNPFDF